MATAYDLLHCTKHLTIDIFLEVLSKEKMFWSFENSKTIFAKTVLFSVALDTHSPEFPTLTNKTLKCFKKNVFKKNVSCGCSEIVGNLPGNGLWWSHFIKLTGQLSRLYTLLEKITSYCFRGSLEKLFV